MRDFREPLPFTSLHRHELRNAIRLTVFWGEIDAVRRQRAFEDIDSDLADGILTHVPIPWTDAFRESEKLGALHAEIKGVRGMDLLHVGLALALDITEFLTFEIRQASLAKAAGFRVKP